MMQFNRKLSALALVALATAGCRDASGPASSPAEAAAPSLSWGSGPGTGAGSSGTATFVVYPNNPTKVSLGDHRIAFARRAICDPATSSYGPGTWDAPCDVAPAPVSITATWWIDEAGNPRIDFQPALRFNPISEVQLELRDRRAAANREAYRIFWVDESGALVDEALTDSTVATHVGTNEFLYRRVKHFSGYIVNVGRLSYDSEGSGGEVDLGFRKRVSSNGPRIFKPGPLQSGHVVATGRDGAGRR